MAVDSTRQICGNCGAFNDPDAVVCVVCGALLAAYATPPEPSPIEPAPTTTTTRPPPVRPPTNDQQPTPATDERTLFENNPTPITGDRSPLQIP